MLGIQLELGLGLSMLSRVLSQNSALLQNSEGAFWRVTILLMRANVLFLRGLTVIDG